MFAGPGTAKPTLDASAMDKFDIDNDGEISIVEARAGMYAHLEKHEVKHLEVKEDLYKGYKRYNKVQEKALRLLENSKDVFGYDTVVPEDRSLLFGMQTSTMFGSKSKWGKTRRLFAGAAKKGMAIEATKAMKKASDLAAAPANVWSDAIQGNTEAIEG